MTSDTDGRAFDLTGQITNSQGTKAWATYNKGPGFLEFDLRTLKIKTHIDGPSGAYAISVATSDFNEGVVATGGADGYVRLWNLADLALAKEYHVAPPGGTVTDVDLIKGGQRAVVGVMRRPKNMEDRYKEGIQVFIVDLSNGTQRKLVDTPSWPHPGVSVIGDLLLYSGFDRMKLASIESGQVVREFVLKKPMRKSFLASNNKWLGVLDEDKILTVFEVDTAREVSSRLIEADDHGPMVITSDGHYVHQVARGGSLTTWNIQSGEMSKHDLTRIQQMHTNVDFITLAHDDQWLVTAGNHGDVGVFERATGKLIFYEQSSAAAFYVEKVWIGGDRLIFTTDTGVMIDGRLVTSAPE